MESLISVGVTTGIETTRRAKNDHARNPRKTNWLSRLWSLGWVKFIQMSNSLEITHADEQRRVDVAFGAPI